MAKGQVVQLLGKIEETFKRLFGLKLQEYKLRNALGNDASGGTQHQIGRNQGAFSRKTNWINIANTRGTQKDFIRGVILKGNRVRVKNHTIVVISKEFVNEKEVMMQLRDMKDVTEMQYV